MSKKMIPILRVGSYKDVSGKSYEITPQILEEIVETYKSDSAPLVKGHPVSNAPAMGWVEKLKITGDELLASFSQINEDFKEAIKQGLFKNISTSFFMPLSDSNPTKGKYHLRHVGTLGASRPAIPNLGTLQEALDPSFCVSTEEGVTFFSENVIDIEFESALEALVLKIVKSLKKNPHFIQKLGIKKQREDKHYNSKEKNSMVENTKPSSTHPPMSREQELEKELEKAQGEIKRLILEMEKDVRTRAIVKEVARVIAEKGLDAATAKLLTKKAEELTEVAKGNISPEEAVANFAEFLPNTTRTHRFQNSLGDHSGMRGIASFAEGDNPIEETKAFADEVDKLTQEGLNRKDAFIQAKENLSESFME